MAGQGERDDEARPDGAALPREVQEHLGRRLRTALEAEAEQPAYLGESTLPPKLEGYVRQLERGERVGRQGYDAVRRALEGDAPPPRRDERA